jgi:hypothetical protein
MDKPVSFVYFWYLFKWMEGVGSVAEVDESEMNMLMLMYGVTESSVGFGE